MDKASVLNIQNFLITAEVFFELKAMKIKKIIQNLVQLKAFSVFLGSKLISIAVL